MILLQMLLLLQMDITSRVEMEKRMAALTETQLSMLEQVGVGFGGGLRMKAQAGAGALKWDGAQQFRLFTLAG